MSLEGNEKDDDNFFASVEDLENKLDQDAEGEPSLEDQQREAFESGLNVVLEGQELESGSSRTENDNDLNSLFSGVTKDQLMALIDKANRVDDLESRMKSINDKAFGTIGHMQQTINELRERVGQGGSRLNVSKDKFQKIASYFDDEGVAEAFAEDLASLELGGGGFTEQQMQEKLDGIQKQFELKLLDIAHKDWRNVVNTEDFAKWTQTLRPEAVEALQTSWDGVKMASAISEFKSWRDGRSQAADEKRRRLEDNISPRHGSAGNHGSVNYDDAFNQGLKNVVAQRHHR